MHGCGLLWFLAGVEGLKDVQSDMGIIIELGADQSPQAATSLR